MAEYVSKEELWKWGTCIAKRNDNKELIPKIGIHLLPTADVIERYEYEFLKQENKELAIKYDNAMNMVINEQENVTRLRSKIDKAIEEIQNAHVCECHCITCIRTEDVLEILRRI